MPVDAPQRFWQCFADLKRDACYIDLYHAHTESIDRAVSMFSALTSSVSIGAWAVWQKYETVWACIIAASQVLQAVRSYLPFSKRLRSLGVLGPELNALVINAEADWLKTSKGQLTIDDIDALYIKYSKKIGELIHKDFPNQSLPQHARLTIKADQEAKRFLKIYHGS